LIDPSDVLVGLRERKYDCVVMPVQVRLRDEAAHDLNVDILYDDRVIVAAAAHSKWARRRKIDLAELIDEPWIFVGPTSWNQPWSEELFQVQGLRRPEPLVTTDSIILRGRLVAAGPCVGMFATSVLRRLIADNYAITALPVGLHPKALSQGIVTLKNRTLSPVVERFLACTRETAAALQGKQGRRGLMRSSKSS
jgi:DNA-binding transcriptional LysR family regulator